MIDATLALLLGLLIGSFLNVCIHRLPRDLSVVRPRSYCPACEKTIAWHDNIPLASFLRLGGRCRHCGARIPLRYPAVELLTGASFFFFVAALGPTLAALKFCLFAALLIGMFFSDLEQMILPDEFTLGGFLAGLTLAWFVPVDDPTLKMVYSITSSPPNPHRLSMMDALLGAGFPALFLWLSGWLFEKIRHKEGLGFGDVKMVACLGAFLGLRLTLMTLVLASVLGSVLGLLLVWITKKDASTYELPFGSFLALTAFGMAVSAVWK